MKFFQAILDFFETLFNSSSPEVQKRQQKKKMEIELRSMQPVLYSNGFLQANFAEAIRILYVNGKTLNEIFSETILSPDIPKRHRFESQLVLTGFSQEEQNDVLSLSYENRKDDIASSKVPAQKSFDAQHRILERIIKTLNSDTFRIMDININNLKQLADLCRLNFMTVLQTFDPNFNTVSETYVPTFQEMALTRFTNVLEDLYYQINGLKIDSSVANATIALATLKAGTSLSAERERRYNDSIKKIAYVTNKILTADYIKKLLCLAKSDTTYEPKSVEYKESARQNFANHLQQQYQADEQRIKSELKNERISSDLVKLFNSAPLIRLQGYDSLMNDKLQANSALSFTLITPLQILKMFLLHYFTEPIRALINDIVVEGFFNNPTYKSDFSALVFSAFESSANIEAFEDKFSRGKEYDIVVLEGYIRDSKTDTSFYTKMEGMVQIINNAAQKLLQDEVNVLKDLFLQLSDILIDAKKPTGEIITNLRLLMMSSRNRDHSDMLEQQLPKWQTFFDVIKNYTIVNMK
ncbi:MAG: hypothetical protein IJR49_06255 [Treponema sp.]|nr:hypothetical protein [Treponema sp.]